MSSETSTGRVIGTVVCLPVRDLPAALGFYQAVFGLSGLEIDEGIVTVELPGLSLFLIEENTFESYTRKTGRGAAYPGEGTGVILSCAVASAPTLDGMLEAVADNGGTVAVPAAVDAAMGLYLGYFFDPDGHHWELAHSGGDR
ncbi:hypothetical protein FB566_0676 [Stackebrandtia endophytica]|uniref:VOC domain-containing protein n=1 Tax=Stackebrandtia endophytica TaxID=1496996 RepID=A0A543ARG9_9ACTN|nr:VOC family protein [Stackebrandtia endophytica]TQL75180.1 hypothetical protein FB566_0676 [Stackebrandtia endophytica]